MISPWSAASRFGVMAGPLTLTGAAGISAPAIAPPDAVGLTVRVLRAMYPEIRGHQLSYRAESLWLQFEDVPRPAVQVWLITVEEHASPSS